MMGPTPKQIKEAFYRHNPGAAQDEVTGLVMCLPLGILLAEVAKCALGCLHSPDAAWADLPLQQRIKVFIVELLVFVYLQAAVYTQLLPPRLSYLVLLAGLVALAIYRTRVRVVFDGDQRPGTRAASFHSCNVSDVQAAVDNLSDRRNRRCVGAFRGLIMVSTCICILAVDFRVFPRRYGKTETSGFGLMDVGVGGIVLAGGVVTKAVYQSAPATSAASLPRHQQLWRRIVSGLRAAIPCWVLWAVRLVSVKAVDYQEHEGEYGVHWNFFATIACLALAQHLLLPLPAPALLALTLGLVTAHQAALSQGVGQWVQAPDRDPTSWISLNKEGLGSLPGYLGISLAGALMGHALHHTLITAAAQVQHNLNRFIRQEQARAGHTQSDMASSRTSEPKQCVRLGQLIAPLAAPLAGWLVVVSLLWLGVAITELYVEPLSRRSANLGYVVWIAAIGVSVLLPLVVGQVLLPGGLQARIPQAVSKNLLPVFLVANLMTGAVNLSLDTLNTSDTLSRAIIAAYSCLVCCVAVALEASGVVLKIR